MLSGGGKKPMSRSYILYDYIYITLLQILGITGGHMWGVAVGKSERRWVGNSKNPCGTGTVLCEGHTYLHVKKLHRAKCIHKDI